MLRMWLYIRCECFVLAHHLLNEFVNSSIERVNLDARS